MLYETAVQYEVLHVVQHVPARPPTRLFPPNRHGLRRLFYSFDVLMSCCWRALLMMIMSSPLCSHRLFSNLARSIPKQTLSFHTQNAYTHHSTFLIDPRDKITSENTNIKTHATNLLVTFSYRKSTKNQRKASLITHIRCYLQSGIGYQVDLL